jgi:16S rRNA (uracil1498-N3)-methyltransferase
VSAPIFFVPREELLDGAVVAVTGSEGRHASVVRRLRPGQLVQLTDGAGLLAEGVVESADRSALSVRVARRTEQVRPTPMLTVVQAIPKGERGELAVELMTELGVDVIVPWAAARCVARWGKEREEKRRQRWESTAHEAAKQARRVWWPVIEPLASTDQVLAIVTRSPRALVLHEQATAVLSPASLQGNSDVVVVVGPEGGLTDEEVDGLKSAGGTVVGLGPTVLRASTAGAAAAAVIFASGPRWSTQRGQDA